MVDQWKIEWQVMRNAAQSKVLSDRQTLREVKGVSGELSKGIQSRSRNEGSEIQSSAVWGMYVKQKVTPIAFPYINSINNYLICQDFILRKIDCE